MRPEKASASTYAHAAAKSVRLRRRRITARSTHTVATAANEPAMQAYTPIWCVHLVGRNAIITAVPATVATNRQVGADAMPASRRRLSSMTTTTIRHTNVMSTPNRRAMPPSAVGFMSM
ncbi:Uncharacterised protein [Mycobacteroides abscessus subsp. abscessus]|nr:Uncharacterised protein [Mycobacteroides abscessus subsp. abscessus]